MPADEKYWDVLLPAIARGEVVPVVGRGMLWISHGGREVLLYQILANVMAGDLGLAPTAGADLEQLTAAYLDQDRGNVAEDIHGKMEVALQRLRDESRRLPEVPLLKQLATLPLPLWLTTSVDPLVQETLGVPEQNVGRYATQDYLDLPSGQPRPDERRLFHLFGRLQDGPGRAAFLDVDVLEFLWCLHGDLREKLRNLAARLASSRLLLLGTSHPDWLARFFLRLTRTQALGTRDNRMRGKREFIADPLATEDPRLSSFISVHDAEGAIFQVRDIREFVPELIRRWEKHRQDSPPRTTASGTGVGGQASSDSSELEQNKAIFISYSSGDRAAAETFASKLREKGLTYWFDTERQDDELAGTDWWKVIRESVRTCDIFIALVSRNTVSKRDEGPFMREWKEAVDRSGDINDNIRRFLWILVVDETEPTEVNYPKMDRRNVNRAPGGHASDTLLDAIKEEVRARRKRLS